MKFSNGTELRFGTPKYSRVSSRLFVAASALVYIAHFVYPKSPNWISDIGLLFVVAGLVVSLIGMMAERKEWQSKHQPEQK